MHPVLRKLALLPRRARLVWRGIVHWLRSQDEGRDTALSRLSHFAQWGLLIAAGYTLLFTVVPIYQKEVLTEKVSRLEIDAERGEERLVALDAEVAAARTTLDEERRALKGLRAEFARVAAARNDAEGRAARADGIATQAEQRFASATKQLDSTRHDLAAAEKKLSSTTRELTELQTRLANAQQQVARSEQALSEAGYERARRDELVKIAVNLDRHCAFATGIKRAPNVQTCMNEAATESISLASLDGTDRRLVAAWVAAEGKRALESISARQDEALATGKASIDVEAEFPEIISAQQEFAARCFQSDPVRALVGRTVLRYAAVQRAIDNMHWGVLQRVHPQAPPESRRARAPTGVRLE